MLRSLLCAAALALTATSASAVLTITILNNGSDVVMRATGDYDFSAMSPAFGVGLSNNAVIIPILGSGGSYGWKTPGPNADGYPITFDNTLGAATALITPSVYVISHPFYLSLSNGVISLPDGAPQVASGIYNFARFTNTSIEAMGLAPGVINVSWLGGDGAIVQVIVPETSTYITWAGFIALACFVWRRRQRAVANK